MGYEGQSLDLSLIGDCAPCETLQNKVDSYVAESKGLKYDREYLDYVSNYMYYKRDTNEDILNYKEFEEMHIVNMYRDTGIGKKYEKQYNKYLNGFGGNRKPTKKQILKYSEFEEIHQAKIDKLNNIGVEYPEFHKIRCNKFAEMCLISDILKYQYYDKTDMKRLISESELMGLVEEYNVKLSKKDTTYEDVFYKLHNQVKKWQSGYEYGLGVMYGVHMKVNGVQADNLFKFKDKTACQIYNMIKSQEKKSRADVKLMKELYKLPRDVYMGDLTIIGNTPTDDKAEVVLAYINKDVQVRLEEIASRHRLPLFDTCKFVRQNYKYTCDYYRNTHHLNKLAMVTGAHSPRFLDAPPWAGDDYFTPKYYVRFMDGTEDDLPTDGYDVVYGFIKLGSCAYVGGLHEDDKDYFKQFK